MVSQSLPGLSVGDQLGNLEYLIDSEAIQGYRRLVGADCDFPNLMADDCVSLAKARFPDLPVAAFWRRFEFLRPPIVGRRIQVGGWLKDIEDHPRGLLLRISAFAVDDIGTEILRSEAALLANAAMPTPESAPAGCSPPAAAPSPSHTTLHVGQTIPLGYWVGPDTAVDEPCLHVKSVPPARPAGISPGILLAGWLEGRLGSIFGDDFRWGGRLALTHHAPIATGEMLTVGAVVAERDTDHAGTQTVALVLAARDAVNRPKATGLASIKMPSPRLI